MSNLKYLFIAYYNDGTRLVQSQEDKSAIEEGKSAFFDIDHSKLIVFTLHGDDGVFTIDLSTGIFEVNSVPFIVDTEPAENRRLIFFRRHRHTMTQTGDEKAKETAHVITYRLGWQGMNKDGKNVQAIIEFY